MSPALQIESKTKRLLFSHIIKIPLQTLQQSQEKLKMNGAKEESNGKGNALSLEDLKKKLADFADERDWNQFHTPRNLLLAMVGEVGELSEIFQWKGEVTRGLADWEEKEKVHLGEELSDVLLYLIRLSDICGIDLAKAALRKIELNAIKYPVGVCKGSSRKRDFLSTSSVDTSTSTTTASTETSNNENGTGAI